MKTVEIDCRMNLLHLEDNEYDADLTEMLIRQEWPDCSITRLATRPEFVDAVNARQFDVILSDYSMPEFNGLAALDIARRTCPSTPFIFLSGTLGEERAIDALKHGATDYLLKGATGRLVPAIRAALRGHEQEKDKQRAQESLRKSQQRFQQITESIHDFIVLLDDQVRCLYSNPAFGRLLGMRNVAPGDELLEHVHPEDCDRVKLLLHRARRSTIPIEVEFRVRRQDGEERHLEALASLTQYHEQDTPALLLAGNDVTDRKRADERLREQASLLDKARDAIRVVGLDQVISFWNATAERMFGYGNGEVLGRSAKVLLYAGQAEQYDIAFALTLAMGEWHGESQLRRKNGSEMVVNSTWSLVNDAAGRPKSILCIDTDVTARKQLERELLRSQRIEGLGMLAGGIAHDLNNMLSPILMSVGYLRRLIRNPEEQAVLDTLETSASHGAELVQQILLFARGGEGHRTAVDLGRLLREASGILKSLLRKSVALEIASDHDLWPTLADATQLKQVIMNLCVNARDAMPRGGSVRITARNWKVLPGTLHGYHGEIPAGRYVRLSVIDTGTGIPPAVLEKIFDPFFTTKEIGKGTGLGLSTIMGIVQAHDGAIEVESVPNTGTTFHIYLPASDATPGANRSDGGAEYPRGRGESILLIDDDEGIRYVAERILTEYGYDVRVAEDGERGLKVFEAQRERFRVVICDQMMPGLSGETVLGRIHREAPGIKLIAMSGLSRTQSGGPGEARVAFLAKPIQTETLLRTVRQVIDGVAI